MAVSSRIQYFLGSNSVSGFHSLYDQLLPPGQARAVYILKGGPGCGKSTLMRRVADEMARAGIAQEYILCSGDPDSLDALVLPQLRVALVDGTAPHVVEPTLPGCVDRYVNLGAGYDHEALFPLREELARYTDDHRACYRRAYRCLASCGGILTDLNGMVLTPALREKLEKRARGILAREFPRQKGAAPGQTRRRFLGAVTHKGALCLFPTVTAQCSRVYELVDPHAISHVLLQLIWEGALSQGYDAIVCPDPLFPQRPAHLLFPQLDLALVSSTPQHPFPGDPFRRIRLDTAADRDILRQNRHRMRFAQKVSSALLEQAVEFLSEGKQLHDRMEALFRPHVDFGPAEEEARRITHEILSFA